MKLFVESVACKSGAHCAACRNLDGGRTFRESLGQRFTLPEDGPDFECPSSKPWGFKAELRRETVAAKDNWGAKLWAELHRRPRRWQGADAERAWLDGFAKRITGGCACVAEWRSILDANPPDLSGPDAYFAWGVLAHNLVNVKLGKPQMGIADAREAWTTAATSRTG